MEQCSISRVAAATVHFFFALAGVLLLVWVRSLQANPATAGRDYLLPGESRGGFISAPIKTQSAQSGNAKQSTVNYQAFDGTNYVLEPHAGRFVTVLLPVTASGEGPFTQDHIEELVDRLDILYSIYRDLMKGEPNGSGPLTIAFVPATCGSGCGLIGSKGVEIKQDTNTYNNIIADLNAGEPDTVLTHEMAHNFDLYWNYLHYLPDHGHAWTDMFEFFAPFRFAREEHKQQTPDDMYQSPSNSVWKPYLEDQKANWERCVKDQLCHAEGFTENHLWAMIYYRIEALYGIDAITGSFAYLKDYVQSHTPPKTTQDKEDLRLMSLAVGAHTNISCDLSVLKWPVSSTLQSDMQARFGSQSKYCSDSDHDGYSVVEGDCDDHDAARNPGALEVQGNGTDDDCDGTVDESNLVESVSTDFPGFSTNAVKNDLPLEITGSLSSSNDRDAVRFTLPPNGRVEAKLCVQDGFSGWVSALQPNGQFLDSEFWYDYLATSGCSRKVYDFGKLASGNLEVSADKNPGQYSLSISPAKDMPAEFSPMLNVVPRTGGGMNIVVNDPQGSLAALGTDAIEVWVSGQALTLNAPYSAQVSIPLTSVTAPGLSPGSQYQARLRPMKSGRPLESYSAGHLFRYDTTPNTPTSLDGGYSGSWFDPRHDGEGFAVEILENGKALVYWFTYTPDGKQRWMIGVGDTQGNSIVVDELLSTHGGRFGPNFNPDDVAFTTIGSLSIDFLDCNNAIVNYSVDKNGGHQKLIRLSNVYGHTCGKSSQSPALDISGSWFDPTHNGEGFVAEQLSADQALVYWFSYTSTGEQAWMFNTASIKNGTINADQVLQSSGGHFGRSYDPAAVNFKTWGNLQLKLDCSGGTATYNSGLAEFSSGRQQLVALTRLQHSACAQ